WRLTYPIRWLAKILRASRAWLPGGKGRDPRLPATAQTEDERSAAPSGETESDFSLKQFFTGLYRTQLQSFLSSKAPFDVPHSENPEISVILVLFNRAEMTLLCLRSLAENYSRGMEVLIFDTASSDETPLLLDRLRGARIIRN